MRRIPCYTPPLLYRSIIKQVYYFYVIKNELDQLYFGSINNLKRRLKEHQHGQSFSTKGLDWVLIYYEAYYAESDAREREYKVKNNTGSKKHLLNRIHRSWQR